jgi:lipoprotein signal peptidase
MKNRGEGKLNKAGIVLVDVGAAANVVQRLFTGCVADYFPFFNLLYFNVWDILIMSGILILFGDTLYEQKRITDRG